MLIQVAFGPVNNVANGYWSSLYRRSATVPYRGRCVNLVIATKKWGDVLPCIARCVEAVQEHDGRTVRRHGAKSYTSPQINASTHRRFLLIRCPCSLLDIDEYRRGEP